MKYPNIGIAKDAEIVVQGLEKTKKAIWRFKTSPVTGQGGPSAPLVEALQKVGIEIRRVR